MKMPSTSRGLDISAQILFAMRNMGIVPIPRNYSLFYEAYIGSNPDLTKDLAALGNNATQEELDELGLRYFDHGQGQLLESARAKLAMELSRVLSVLQHEQTNLENYNRILDETRAEIADKNHASTHLLRTAVAMLVEATGNKMAENETTAKHVDRHAEEMQQVRLELDEYKRIANTDSLTRLSNRRAFDEKLASMYDSTIGLQFSGLVLVDVDNFKRINDTFGHPVGDKILASVASVIRACVRKDIFVARSGGEEFAIILEGSSQEEIHGVCERIRTTLEKAPFRHSKTGIDYGQVTISLGYTLASQAKNPGELYANADIALYHAKETGRNRTVLFQDGMQKSYAGKSWLIYKS